VTAQKITRKQLKQDGFLNWTERNLERLQEHYIKIGIVFLVVVVVLVGASYLRSSRAKAGIQASSLLYMGQSMLSGGSYEAARSRLQECVDRFGGNECGKLAHISLAEAQIALGENELALTTYDSAEQVFGAERPEQIAIMAGRAGALSNLELHEEASAQIREILARDDLYPVRRYELYLLLAESERLAGNPAAGLAAIEELKGMIDAGELDVMPRDLDVRLEYFRSLSR